MKRQIVKSASGIDQIMEIDSDGNTYYRNENEEMHRDDGPAYIDANGDKEWYKNGKVHREDGPAIERANGDKHWYIIGVPHRDGGPAKEFANAKLWYKNGKLHRDGGPAYEHSSGKNEWYKDGLLHRDDGPAIERPDGTKHWFLKNINYTETEFNEKMGIRKTPTYMELFMYNTLKAMYKQFVEIPGTWEKGDLVHDEFRAMADCKRAIEDYEKKYLTH